MQRCIDLAKNGLGITYPNPLVGSVIVFENRIIGEGWHKKAGEPHAEVNAINSVKDQSLLSKSTLYVNLEPCSHFGKTPPCSDLIVDKKIKEVIIGSIDLNSKVSGKGIEHLKNSGCQVEVGILEKQCKELNKRFFTFHKKKRPFIILKWAETKDKFIYPAIQKKRNLKPIWISNIYSLQLVHKWRTEEQAVLVGTNTVKKDNPKLNARNYYGKSPIRLAIDKDLTISKSFNIYDGMLETIIFTSIKNIKNNNNVSLEKINFSKNVTKQILKVLYKREIQSVIIEGGTKTLQSFIDQDLWDEAKIFTGDVCFNDGIKSPTFTSEKIDKNYPCQVYRKVIKNDKLTIYSNG